MTLNNLRGARRKTLLLSLAGPSGFLSLEQAILLAKLITKEWIFPSMSKCIFSNSLLAFFLCFLIFLSIKPQSRGPDELSLVWSSWVVFLGPPMRRWYATLFQHPHPPTHARHSRGPPHTNRSTLACDTDGGGADLAPEAVRLSWVWLSSEITAPLDASCCVKLRHASTYLVKMKTAKKKKNEERKTNRLVTHLAQVEEWEQLRRPKAGFARGRQPQILGPFKMMGHD